MVNNIAKLDIAIELMEQVKKNYQHEGLDNFSFYDATRVVPWDAYQIAKFVSCIPAGARENVLIITHAQLETVRTLMHDNGQYLWGTSIGGPATICNRRFIVLERG